MTPLPTPLLAILCFVAGLVLLTILPEDNRPARVVAGCLVALAVLGWLVSAGRAAT